MPEANEWSQPGMLSRNRTPLEQSRDWLDGRGKAAWLVAMIAGFVLFWPLGLLLSYMIWSNRMTCSRHRRNGLARSAGSATTGNAAFDAYRAETLKRLEEEREAFTAFLEQLRAAKDQAEFDQFMESRKPTA